MADFYLYECRHGDDRVLITTGKEQWNYLIKLMESCNGMTLDEIKNEFGEYAVEGGFEKGKLFVDDGGCIETIKLTEL